MSFTIAYMTFRREPHIEWFLESLARQCKPSDQQVILVDFYADEGWRKEQVERINGPLGFQLKHVTPKPSVWQGKHRITKANYFDAGNARNTALCLTDAGHIAYVDDLSVLAPEWYEVARNATGRIGYTFGSYRKVNNLVVNGGLIAGFSDYPKGHDIRRTRAQTLKVAYQCSPDWLFGCSLVAPTESLLDAGGWPERLCAGMGYEDGCFAKIVRNRKERTWFDARMMTYESEEGHNTGDNFLRIDPCKCNPCTTPRVDKSHAMLAAVESSTRVDNGYDMRSLRTTILHGGEFPIPTEPKTEWFSRTPLTEL